jgi:hypothetical protein
MVGKKDELLRGLDSNVLLQLAKSVSESSIDSGTTRAELVELIKESMSIEEINRKLKQMDGTAWSSELAGVKLTAGGVGQVLLAASGVIGTTGYYSVIISGGALSFSQLLAPWGLVSSVLVLLFAVFLTSSVVKIPREIGGRVGRVTSLFGVLSAIVGMLSFSLEIMNVALVSYLSIPYLILSVSYSWLLGTTMALLGTFFLVCRKHSSSSDLWTASGILYIVGGGSMFGISGLPLIPSASFIAAVFGAICFFTGKFRD